MPWPIPDTIHKYTRSGLPDKGRAIKKGLVVCKSRYVIAFVSAITVRLCIGISPLSYEYLHVFAYSLVRNKRKN